MDNTSRKHILQYVFNDRFNAVRANLIAPFITQEILDGDQLSTLRDKILEGVLIVDGPFEAMAESTIFYGEGVAMKAFTEYFQQVVDEWNQQNKDGKHFSIELNINLVEAKMNEEIQQK